MDGSEWEFLNMEDVSNYIEENGVSGIDDFFKRKLEKWKDVEINIGITGDSGTGKSSFINAIRGLHDDDEMAAKTGVKETTTEPSCYAHPTNSKIRFWDLPGIGTPNYPDLPTYCEKVELVKYDTFLIFTAGRFTENDLELAKKIKSIGKKFFFIRTKIDADYLAEKRKRSFDERAMLKEILDNCCENLVDLLDDRREIFLISNHYPAKWDFARLTQAILDVLPIRQRECLTLSLGVLTSLSTDILQRKIQVLKGRVWMVASASAAGAIVPLPGLSVAVDLALITNEVSFYRSQLGLPEEGTREFAVMNPENQERVRKFFFTTAMQVASFMTVYSSQAVLEEASRFIPFVGLAIAGGISFGSTYYFLHRCLAEIEKTAMSLLEDVARKSVDDFDID